MYITTKWKNPNIRYLKFSPVSGPSLCHATLRSRRERSLSPYYGVCSRLHCGHVYTEERGRVATKCFRFDHIMENVDGEHTKQNIMEVAKELLKEYLERKMIEKCGKDGNWFPSKQKAC